MLFNSIEYIVFIVCLILLFKLFSKYFRTLLLIASLFFYGFYNNSIVVLILYVTFTSYFSARIFPNISSILYRRILLITSVILTLFPLLYYKYTIFFLNELLPIFSSYNNPNKFIEIILPVGISFYTLQTLGYLFDVYRNKTPVEYNIVNYLLFATFFPQLIAGPIERASKLIPQIKCIQHNKIQIYPNINRIVWGLFKKIVIADNIGVLLNSIHFDQAGLGLANILIGYLMYVQIYCDFSGYVDIAIGTAKIFGINLTENFKAPYLAISFRDFWHRWHITLANWFRDYIYIPFGGNKLKGLKFITIILIVFVLSGFWHGANWNYILWGLLHGCLYYFERFLKSKFSNNFAIRYFRGNRLLRVIIMFNLISLTWLIFFIPDLSIIGNIFKQLFYSLINFGVNDLLIFAKRIYDTIPLENIFLMSIGILTLIVFELSVINNFICGSNSNKKMWQNAIYSDFLIIFILISLVTGDTYQFIYFQF